MTSGSGTFEGLHPHFNSHPHEEDDTREIQNHWKSWHFNSHPHEEDDYSSEHRGSGKDISTHILTKRMTRNCGSCSWKRVFQLTSSRRGWQFPVTWNTGDDYYFNSHPHEEDDRISDIVLSPNISFQLTSSRRGWHMVLTEYPGYYLISTHILTKRMTT